MIREHCVILSKSSCLSSQQTAKVIEIHRTLRCGDIIANGSRDITKKSSLAAYNQINVTSMMEHQTENSSATLMRHGKMSFDARFPRRL
jgi:hypothetical protein